MAYSHFIGLSKERPYLVLALNLILSQISSFTHIYGFADFNRFMDFGRFEDVTMDLRISKDHLAHKGQLFYLCCHALIKVGGGDWSPNTIKVSH